MWATELPYVNVTDLEAVGNIYGIYLKRDIGPEGTQLFSSIFKYTVVYI